MPDTQEMIQQHHELIGLCKKLEDAVRRRQPRAEIYQIMDELVTCTTQHFEAEERLMAEAGYPELEGHKAKHKELLERTRKFRKRLELYGEENFTEWFNHWPFPLILAHIQNGDHQIGDHIRHAAPAAPAMAAASRDRAGIPAIMRLGLGQGSGDDADEIKVPKELYAAHAPDNNPARMRATTEMAEDAPYLQGGED